MPTISQELATTLPFFTGSFSEAQREAGSRARYLLVYLHSPYHPLTTPFVQEYLCSDQFAALLRAHFLLYGATVSNKEGYSLSWKFSATTFPFIAIFMRNNMIMKMQGDFTREEFFDNVQLAIENGAPLRAKEVSLAAERAQRDALRLRREAELEEARRIDEKAFAQERAAKAEQERAQREEAERIAAMEMAAEAERIARERRQKELDRRKNLAEEFVAAEMSREKDSSERMAVVKLLSLDGTPNECTFAASSSISILYNFAVSRPEYDGREFELVCGFPPKVIADDGSSKVGDVPLLFPRSVVKMQPL